MRTSSLRLLAAALLFAPVVSASPGGVLHDVIDFENVPAGTVLTQVFGAGGLGPVLVTGINPDLVGQEAALVFDSAQPTGGDDDLGTPNETFGGPGKGVGGELGSPYANETAHGHLCIVAENLVDGDADGLVDDPDDADLVGATLAFDFSALGTVTIESITIVDVETDRPAARVSYYDASDALLGSVDLPQVGDNGLAQVDLDDVAGVVRLVVDLNGSGAIDDISFAVGDMSRCKGRLGDYVWLDLDGDGIQDRNESGIFGVRLELYDESGAFLGGTTTDMAGHYLFTGLCAGVYIVCVDESTLPPCVVPSPCDQGTSERKDNDCSCARVVIKHDGATWRALDFGYTPDDCFAAEGCSPGYWKQPQHVASWPASYAPDMPFGAVFEDAFPGETLLDVLSHGGGGLRALGRQVVAALLNGASGSVAFPLSDADVIDLFDAVYPGKKADYNALADLLAADAAEGCPLD